MALDATEKIDHNFLAVYIMQKMALLTNTDNIMKIIFISICAKRRTRDID